MCKSYAVFVFVFAVIFVLSFPTQAAVKVDWETNVLYSDVTGDSAFAWDAGFQITGDWSLGNDWAFFLRDKVGLNSFDRDWNNCLERFYLQYQGESYRVKIGRQTVVWGIGWIFRPTDLLTPMQSYKEEETRPGKDLFTYTQATSPLTMFELVAGEDTIAIRSDWRVDEINLRILGMTLPGGANILGFDFQGGLAGFYGEAYYQWFNHFRYGKPVIMLGCKKVLGNNNLLFIEYYRNESLNVSQNYLGAGIQIPWDELTSFDVISLYDMDSNEVVLIGMVSLQLSDSLDLKASISVDSGSSIALGLQSKFYF